MAAYGIKADNPYQDSTGVGPISKQKTKKPAFFKTPNQRRDTGPRSGFRGLAPKGSGLHEGIDSSGNLMVSDKITEPSIGRMKRK